MAQALYMGESHPLDTKAGTILAAMQAAGIGFAAPCGGNGVCGKCLVKVRRAGEAFYTLACKTPLEGDMTIIVPEARKAEVADQAASGPYAPEGLESAGYGLAFDIGTTTIAAHLVSLETGECLARAGALNPQCAFGADVIARIQACGQGGFDEQVALVRECMGGLAHDLYKAAGVDAAQLRRAVAVGNTVMQSFVAGVRPDSIGHAPYEPLDSFGGEYRIPQLDCPLYLAPCLAGYIGGDVAAGILACEMGEYPGYKMLLDLGTNGEIALGSRDGLLCCSTAAGPVFEAANIACGMTASDGAITRVAFAGGALACEVMGGGLAKGLCGSGVISAVAAGLAAGLIRRDGRICAPDEAPAGLAHLVEERSERVLLLADGVFLTQADVRNVQLAKAAIFAGIELLIESAGCEYSQLDELILAGGLGLGLNVDDAAAIGLFPRELAGKARAMGNTAISGADALLLSARARKDAGALAGRATCLDLNANPDFMDCYVEAMDFAE